MNPAIGVVYTNPARCRDCYKCLRVCPVKAIRLVDGQAQVDPDRCILCGNCIRECPQGAKTYRRDGERVQGLLAGSAPVAVSVAPSFAGWVRPSEWRRLPSALRRLGFGHVSETAVGAWHSAHAVEVWRAGHPDALAVESSCPAVVRYIERYRPDRAADLAPVLSPMLTHATVLRRKLGPRWRIVFIGPCVAKKAEADRPEHRGLVDAVLTFEELRDWLDRQEIDLARLEESDFDMEPGGEARHYPLLGGCMRTSDPTAGALDPAVLAVTGPDEVRAALDLDAPADLRLVAPLFCPQGCIGGPGVPDTRDPLERRQEVLNYARRHPGRSDQEPLPDLDLETSFTPCPPPEAAVTEDEIRSVLERTGKADPVNQLDCGACGYDSCREAAVAVVRGMAEPEMCLPWMRRRAERRADQIVEASPNGIMILDAHLRIVSINPAFRRLFLCSDAVIGRPVSYLLDPAPFAEIQAGSDALRDKTVAYDQYGCVCRQLVFRLERENQVVGIFVNVTEAQETREEIAALRTETARGARELLEHQVQMAQELTRFLGENTARGEELVAQMLSLVRRQTDPEPHDEERFGWPNSTST